MSPLHDRVLVKPIEEENVSAACRARRFGAGRRSMAAPCPGCLFFPTYWLTRRHGVRLRAGLRWWHCAALWPAEAE
eukprot:364707-Chlamydomonas_euryale.AAC.14